LEEAMDLSRDSQSQIKSNQKKGAEWGYIYAASGGRFFLLCS
jgi:hypothetical protein